MDLWECGSGDLPLDSKEILFIYQRIVSGSKMGIFITLQSVGGATAESAAEALIITSGRRPAPQVVISFFDVDF
jgi:hypothetical protein